MWPIIHKKHWYCLFSPKANAVLGFILHTGNTIAGVSKQQFHQGPDILYNVHISGYITTFYWNQQIIRKYFIFSL